MTLYTTSAYALSTSNALDRVRYFPRQLITADDMMAEQEYFRERLRRHNCYLHGWGVVCGCEVKLNADADHPWRVRVCPGYLVTPRGDEIRIPEAVDFDLARDVRQPPDPCARPSPCAPAIVPATGTSTKIYLAVCYAECNMRPVRIHPAGCGCDDASCEYSRIRDSFELVRLVEEELPESYKKAADIDKVWYDAFQKWKSDGAQLPLKVPDCSDIPGDDCVVLARIDLPANQNTELVGNDIKDRRRALYSVTSLQWMIPGLPVPASWPP